MTVKIYSEEYDKLARLQTDSVKDKFAASDLEMLNTAEKSLLAIAYLLDKEEARATTILKVLEKPKDNDPFRSLYLEAELLISSKKLSNLVTLQDRAKEVVRLNPDAIFANRILSMSYFQLNDYEGGKKTILRMLDRYPDSNFLYADLIRALANGKKYKEARRYISNVENIPRRYLFWVYLNGILPYRIFLLIPLLFLLVLPTTSFPTFIITSVLGLLFLIASHLLREKWLFMKFAGIVYFVTLIFVLGRR